MLKIKDITIMGVFLSIIIIGKIIDLFLPHLPNGLDEGSAFLPLIIISGSILVGFKRAFIPVLLYVFAIMWIGSGFFMQPLSSSGWISEHSQMNQGEVFSGIYFLDYVLPLLVLVIPSLFKTKTKILISSVVAMVLNYLFHVLSGYIIWSSFGSKWGLSMVLYSFVGNGIRFLFLALTGTTVISLLIKNKKHIIQDGYVNDSFKVKKNGQYYQKRVPKLSIADWENEKNVYRNLNINVEFEENGVFYKPWVKGNVVKGWNRVKIDSLREKIQLFHKGSTKDIISHKWDEYNEYGKNINEDIFRKYILDVSKMNKTKLVLSHNDINRHNVLWDKKEITLIDFEWSRLNNEYFDYAQFEIAEGFKILPSNMNHKEYDLVLRSTLVFSLLWTYSMPNSNKVIKLRKKYLKMIENQHTNN